MCTYTHTLTHTARNSDDIKKADNFEESVSQHEQYVHVWHECIVSKFPYHSINNPASTHMVNRAPATLSGGGEEGGLRIEEFCDFNGHMVTTLKVDLRRCDGTPPPLCCPPDENPECSMCVY